MVALVFLPLFADETFSERRSKWLNFVCIRIKIRSKRMEVIHKISTHLWLWQMWICETGNTTGAAYLSGSEIVMWILYEAAIFCCRVQHVFEFYGYCAVQKVRTCIDVAVFIEYLAQRFTSKYTISPTKMILFYDKIISVDFKPQFSCCALDN